MDRHMGEEDRTAMPPGDHIFMTYDDDGRQTATTLIYNTARGYQGTNTYGVISLEGEYGIGIW